MTHIESHETHIDAANDGFTVLIHPASPEAVHTVLSADEHDIDGRSQFVWLRLPNGDLFLGVFPQGDTYLTVKDDAAYVGPLSGTLWCEECGERPQLVHTQHAGLCCVCAAATIDDV